MAVQKVVSANAYKKFDSATILFGGNIASTSRITNVDNIEHMGIHTGRAGSKLPSPLTNAQIATNTAGDPEPAAGRSKNPTFKPYSAGTYGYMAKNEYQVIGLSSKISGVASTVLYMPSSDFGRKPTYLRSGVRSSFLRVFTWTANSESGPTYTKTYSNRTPAQNDMNGQDNASVLVTRALPGELQFMYGAKTALQTDYVARTG